MRELEAAERIVHAGDFVTVAVLGDLQDFAPVVAVHGNVDEPALRERLPAEAVFEVGSARVGLVHDAGPRRGRAKRLAARFPGCAAVVYGHSHVPELGEHGGLWLLNPGSPTDRRRQPVGTMIRLEAGVECLDPQLVALA